MINRLITLLFLFAVGHAIADFALQTNIMAKLKNRKNKPDWIPNGQKYVPTWFYWLGAHALIHGGMVYLITGFPLLGIAESILHAIIDFAKCENLTSPHTDQILHFICKLSYAIPIWVGSIV